MAGYKKDYQQYLYRSGKEYKSNMNENANYYFRVRTETDKDGNVISGMYGKIYGDFPAIIYYLNPDGTRNIEFDPEKNLFKNDKHKYRP